MAARSARLCSLLAALVLVLLAAAACSGGGAAPSPNPGATTGATVGTPGGTDDGTATEPPAGAAVDPCTLLSHDEIREITGFEVQSTGGSKYPREKGTSVCQFNLSGGEDWTIHLETLSPGGRSYFDTWFVPFIEVNGSEEVAGLGDDALKVVTGQLATVKGDTLVIVRYLSGIGDDIPRALAERALSHLP